MEKIRLKVKYFNPACKLEIIEKGDWVDVRSAQTVDYKAGEVVKIYLGFAMKLPDGKEAHVLPRSSTFKKWGLILVNSEGIIDNTFNGDNDQWFVNFLAFRDGHIDMGDRVGQFRIYDKMSSIDFEEVAVLGNPDRGGEGSTGHK